MSLNAEKLYQLLPAVYQIRDAERGYPLKALISVLAEQAKIIEDDIAHLYENWFIETCDEWLVPYIGDLLRVWGIYPDRERGGISQRAYIANSLRYRRRKGTATVLEQLALDITGWRARVVEFFQILCTTENYNHLRLRNHLTLDLRQTKELELLNTTFDSIAHTIDVRPICNRCGWHNIPRIGIFLWRLQSYPVTKGTARAVTTPPDGCYTFNPLGCDAPLFNRPQTETKITHLAEEINVPGLLRRRPLYDELEARRQAEVDGRTPEYIYFDDRTDTGKRPVLEIFTNGSNDPIPADQIVICNLERWDKPNQTKTYKKIEEDVITDIQEKQIKVAVDPVLGRLTFSDPVGIEQVWVNYSYGFSGDIGGGPYNRRVSLSSVISREVTWQVGVSKEAAPVPGEIYSTLRDAIAAWNNWFPDHPNSVGVIAILDSHTYKESLIGNYIIKIPEKGQLLIVAAGWPEVDVPGSSSGEKQRILGAFDPVGRRPHILGDISVKGEADEESETPGELILDGILIEGTLNVLKGNLGGLRISHCTVAPDKGGLSIKWFFGNDKLKVNLFRSICGPITFNPKISKLHIDESIVDYGSSTTYEAITCNTTDIELQRCTVFGSVNALTIRACNSIFTGIVRIERKQTGCIRFSYIPAGSETPRRFHCQPDLVLDEAESSEEAEIRNMIAPSFTSKDYRHYGYGQLDLRCPQAISTGAEDGSEMGVFSFLRQPQRIANLQTSLREYLRFGLRAGSIYVT